MSVKRLHGDEHEWCPAQRKLDALVDAMECVRRAIEASATETIWLTREDDIYMTAVECIYFALRAARETVIVGSATPQEIKP